MKLTKSILQVFTTLTFIASVSHAEARPIFPLHLHLLAANKHLLLDYSSDYADSNPKKTKNYIFSKKTVVPFEQWNTNSGYCGEVSLLQAGMNNGQWMSQYNERLICGSGLSQSGPDGFCAAHGNNADYNAQVLLEYPNPGDAPFDSAPLCLSNARLGYETFNYKNQKSGMAGYQEYISWIKAQLIKGNQVTIGVLNHGGTDEQYDHEVTVTKIGTHHSVNDANYYADDVIYFDEHGRGGEPYFTGYTVSDLAHSREDANTGSAFRYSILIPGKEGIQSGSGGDGINPNPRLFVAHNYAVSVSGPADDDKVTLPVSLRIASSTSLQHPNEADPVNGFNFEIPGVGDEKTNACTNEPPIWMDMVLEVTVRNLVPGKSYNLYEYDFDKIEGLGESAQLKIPSSKFNANAAMASKVTQIVASSSQYTKSLSTTSDKIIAFRCVSAEAP